MSNIYQIQEDLKAIFAELEENGGELTPELEEQLTFTQESFKSKIESYANVVKQLEYDITCIKAEKARLSDLQKSKENTIDRLKHIMAIAINTYGEQNKSGNHFVDYGTGKVSVRTTESVEVDEDITTRFVNRFMSCLNWYKMQNQLSQDFIDYQDILNYINSKSPEEEENNDVIPKINIDECENISFDFDTTMSVRELLQSKAGFNLAKALIEYNNFKVKPKIDKIAIKNEAKLNATLPIYANLVAKESVTIK